MYKHVHLWMLYIHYIKIVDQVSLKQVHKMCLKMHSHREKTSLRPVVKMYQDMAEATLAC